MKDLKMIWGPVLLTASGFILLIHTILPSSGKITYGFAAYYTAARIVVEGRLSPAIYDNQKFQAEVEHETFGQASDIYWANPPTTSLMFVPLALFSPVISRYLWMGLCVAALGLTSVLLAHMFLRNPYRLNIFCLITSIFLLSSPLSFNFVFGQVYIVILMIMCLALFALDRRIDWLAGFCIALPLVFKASGLPLLIILLINGHWRVTAWALLAFTAMTLATLPLIGIAIWKIYLIQVIPNFLHDPVIAVTAYQTIYGFFFHLFGFHPIWNPDPLVDWPFLKSIAPPFISFCFLVANGFFPGRSSLMKTFSLGLILSVILIPAAEQYHYVLLLPAYFLILLQQRTKLLPVVISAALIALPLPYMSMVLSKSWLAILAYPRLYGAIILFFALLFSTPVLQPHMSKSDY